MLIVIHARHESVVHARLEAANGMNDVRDLVVNGTPWPRNHTRSPDQGVADPKPLPRFDTITSMSTYMARAGGGKGGMAQLDVFGRAPHNRHVFLHVNIQEKGDKNDVRPPFEAKTVGDAVWGAQKEVRVGTEPSFELSEAIVMGFSPEARGDGRVFYSAKGVASNYSPLCKDPLSHLTSENAHQWFGVAVQEVRRLLEQQWDFGRKHFGPDSIHDACRAMFLAACPYTALGALLDKFGIK